MIHSSKLETDPCAAARTATSEGDANMMISKRIIGRIATAGILATGMALAGCSSTGKADESETPATDVLEADEGVMEDAVNDQGSGAGMANPMKDATSASEAGQGAGIGAFSVPASVTAGGSTIANPVFSYMEGLAEASYDNGTTEVVIRKGVENERTMSVSGDYNGYEQSWIIESSGRIISCNGHEKGKISLAEWNDDASGCSFSVGCYGSDDQPVAMSEDELLSIAPSIQ